MHEASRLTPLRTRVYVDGYNFYYGCLKGTAWKWLDLLVLFEKFILPSVQPGSGASSQLSALLSDPSVKFFTAPIIERVAKANDSVSCQARYHRALRKLHPLRIEIIEGYYAVNEMKVRLLDLQLPNRPPRECADALAWKIEEKQSDVSLALHAYHDAMTGAVDQVVLVTNDTDLAPALQMIRMHTPVVVGLVIPTRNRQRRPNGELASQAHWVRTNISIPELAGSQLPRVIPGRHPTCKPDSWYGQPRALAEILELAIPVRGSRAGVFKWLDACNPHLNHERPIELIETVEGAQRVLDYIRTFVAQTSNTRPP